MTGTIWEYLIHTQSTEERNFQCSSGMGYDESFPYHLGERALQNICYSPDPVVGTWYAAAYLNPMATLLRTLGSDKESNLRKSKK